MGFVAPAVSAIGGFLGSGTGLGLLGLGTAALMYSGMNNAMSGMGDNSSALLDMQNDNASALDNLPTAPEAPTNDVADNSAAEQARKEQLAAIAQAEQQNMVNPTGGLGVGGKPNVNKKQLLGT